jgi:hypothetical protein
LFSGNGYAKMRALLFSEIFSKIQRLYDSANYWFDQLGSANRRIAMASSYVRANCVVANEKVSKAKIRPIFKNNFGFMAVLLRLS